MYGKAAKILQRVFTCLLPAFPHANFLPNYGLFAKTKKLTLVYYYY